MKNLISIVTILFSSSLLYAQWGKQECGTINTLLDIKFVNSSVGYLTEDKGKIFKTTNRGVDWIEQITGTTDFLNSISFINQNTGWAVGMNDGIVIKTTDGGRTWNTVAIGFAVELLDIQFITDQIGWTVGFSGQIWKTTNGGNNWVSKNSNTQANLWSVYFIDTNIGFAVGDSVILKTTDGGNNWAISYKTAAGKKLDSFKSIFFVDNNYGYAVGVDWQTGETLILHTIDGGGSWIRQNSGLNGLRLQSVMFINQSEGWAVGEAGNILSTSDGGEHWILEQSGVTGYLRAVYAVDNSNVYAVGENATILTNSKFIKLTMNWDENTHSANFSVGSTQRITWESENINNVKIEYTVDAGKNWMTIESNYSSEIGYYDWVVPNTTGIYCKVKISDVSNSSLFDLAPSTKQYRTSDFDYKWHFTIYGANNKWEEVETLATSTLSGIKFLDNYNGIAWGPNVLLETTDEGSNWQVRSTFSSRQAQFVDRNNGWIVIDKYQGYDSSVVMHTTDGGITWIKQYSIETAFHSGLPKRQNFLINVNFIDDANGWLLTLSSSSHLDMQFNCSSVYRTTNGGENWIRIDNGELCTGIDAVKEKMNYITFTNENIGWAQVNGGYIWLDYISGYGYPASTVMYLTTDGGISWNPTSTPIPPNPNQDQIWAYDHAGFFDQSNQWISRSINVIIRGQLSNIILYKNGVNLYEASDRGPKSFYFKNSDLGWYLGDAYHRNTENDPTSYSYPYVCMTKDGGLTWELQDFNRPISGFFTLDGNVCWAVGGSKIFRYGTPNPPVTNDFALPLTVSDNCTHLQSLQIGTATDATNGYDASYDQYAPPTAPAGAFDGRLRFNSEDYLKDFRATNVNSAVIWNLIYQPATSCSPVTISWNSVQLPSLGYFTLVDAITGGSLVKVDMRTTSSYTDNLSLGNLQIVFKYTTTKNMSIASGWNMLGLPLEVEDANYKTLYPNAITGTLYGFNGAYFSTEEFNLCKGYWLRFPGAETVPIAGTPISTPHVISLSQGWNMITGLSCDIALSSVSDPGGIIIPGTLYGFNESYYSSSNIVQGQGYWVRANAEGTITLDCSTGPLAKSSTRLDMSKLESDISEFSKIEIKDGNGIIQNLYFSGKLDENINIESYSLPPVAPNGMFDVRFSSGYKLVENDEVMVNIQSDSYPVKIKIDGNGKLSSNEGYLVKELSGGKEITSATLKEKQELVINDSKVNSLVIKKGQIIPVEYSLEQNYPNPFNPTTTIKFGLPEATKVKIKIYSVLGELMAELIDQEMEAGYQRVEFNALNYASGVYLYRIETEKFNAIKKMIILK